MDQVPSVLYKYVSMNQSYHWEMLILNYWYFSHKDQFNDPLDFNLRWTFEKKLYSKVIRNLLSCLDSKQKKIFRSLLSKADMDPKPSFSDVVNFLKFHGFLSEKEMISKIKFLKGFFELYKRFVDNTGIYSMTDSCENPLMWAYYTNHSGICIGYDMLRVVDYLKKDETQFTWAKTKSSDEAPKPIVLIGQEIEGGEINFSNYNGELADALSVKDSVWEHENEYRIINHSRSKYKEYLPKEVIKEVIFGLRVDIATRKAIKKLLGDKVAYKQTWFYTNQHKIFISEDKTP